MTLIVLEEEQDLRKDACFEGFGILKCYDDLLHTSSLTPLVQYLQIIRQ